MNQFLIKMRLPFFIFSIVFFFVVERYLSGEVYFKSLHFGSLLLVVLATIVPFILGVQAKSENQKKCFWYFGIWQLLVALAVFFYLILNAMTEGGTPDSPIQKVVYATMLLCGVIGLFSGIGAELAKGMHGTSFAGEPRRIQRSMYGWLICGLCLAVLSCLNYISVKKDIVSDWSYLKTAAPSEATLGVLAASKETIEVSTFYTKDNEVRSQIDSYFESLASKSDKINWKKFDKDLDPVEADEKKVSRNGQVIVELGGNRERIDTGMVLASARNTLRKFDAEFQKALLRVLDSKKTLYFTEGHGELTWSGSPPSPLDSLKALESGLRGLNYDVKKLSLQTGLGSEMPSDAAAVVVVGPTSAFLVEEVETLRKYLMDGGRLFLLLDLGRAAVTGVPEIINEGLKNDPLLGLLSEMGLSYKREPVANDQTFMRATKSPLDHWFIVTNNFGSHQSVSTLAKNDDRAEMLFFQSGHFEFLPKKDGWENVSDVRSFRGSYLDLNRNFKFDQSTEKEGTFHLVIAGSKKIPELATGAEKVAEPEQKSTKEKEARIIAVADANIISDGLLQSRANQLFMIDALNWLSGREAYSGEQSSEEDVKIEHSKKEDILWFNSTILIMPLLVLGFGYAVLGRRRRYQRH